MTSIAKRLDTHFATCAAAAAGVAVLGGIENAEARPVVYSGTLNWTINNNFAGIYVQLHTGSTATAGFLGQDFNPYYGGDKIWMANAAQNALVSADGTNASSMSVGQTVGAAQIYTAGVFPGMTNLTDGGTHFLGIRFLNESTGLTHYGWIRYTRGLGAAAGTLIDYAWENVGGTSINVGDGIPAPGALALLALGAVGMRGRRRAS